MYLISAYFDDESNKILQEHINRVAQATGNSFMLDNHVPPHITISAIEARSSEVLVPTFEELAGRIASDKISIVTVGQFMPRVLYVAPFLNEYLADLQRVVTNVYTDVPETTINKFYRPFSWLPHITIGKTFGTEQMVNAIEVMKDFKPIDATIVKIGLSEVNPHKDVRVMSLVGL